MLKTAAAVLAAATIAAAVTALSAPTTPVNATPLAASVTEPMNACAQRAWPYLRCVGTAFGNPRIRLVTTDRLTHD